MGDIAAIPIRDFLEARVDKFDPSSKELHSYRRLDKIDFSGTIHLSDKISKTDMIIVHPGDLVISGINVAKGAVAVHDGTEPISATIHYSSYKFDPEKVEIEYFRRYLKSDEFIDALKEQVRGGIKTEIKAKTFLSILVPLPNIKEQRRIVSDLKRSELELVELSGEIENQETLIKVFRQSILQEAIEGKLTADWRKKNPYRAGDPERDAEALLVAIANHWKLNGVKTRGTKNGQLLNTIPTLRSWIETNIDSIGMVRVGGTPDRGNEIFWNGPIPWVSSGEVANCIIQETRESITTEGSKNSAAKVLPKGTVLVAMIGQGKTRGQTAILELSAASNQNVCGIQIDHKLINPKWLWMFFLSQYEFSRSFASGGNQPALNGEKVGSFRVLLPPLAEQAAIVERVEALLACVDELEKELAAQKGHTEELMREVLRDAFERV